MERLTAVRTYHPIVFQIFTMGHRSDKQAFDLQNPHNLIECRCQLSVVKMLDDLGTEHGVETLISERKAFHLTDRRPNFAAGQSLRSRTIRIERIHIPAIGRTLPFEPTVANSNVQNPDGSVRYVFADIAAQVSQSRDGVGKYLGTVALVVPPNEFLFQFVRYPRLWFVNPMRKIAID